MKLREIERLRAFAVIMVIVHHWGVIQPFFRPYFVDGGRHGVDLFFVISGYVVTLSLLRGLPEPAEATPFFGRFEAMKIALKAFYVRRLTRILPLAVVTVLLHRVGVAFFPNLFGDAANWNAEAIAIFAGMYNYFYPATARFQFGYFWSLMVEEHFYLFLPLLFVACRTRAQRALGCVVVILLVVFVFRPLSHPDYVKELDHYECMASHLRFDSLMAGALLALAAGSKPSPPMLPRPLLRYVLLPALAMLLWALGSVVPYEMMMREGFVAIWVMAGILVAFASLDRGYVFELPLLPFVGGALEYIGSRSYAIYLMHQDVSRWWTALAARWPAYTTMLNSGPRGAATHGVILFASTVLVAEILHRVLEHPIQQWGRRRAESAIQMDASSVTVPV